MSTNQVEDSRSKDWELTQSLWVRNPILMLNESNRSPEIDFRATS